MPYEEEDTCMTGERVGLRQAKRTAVAFYREHIL